MENVIFLIFRRMRAPLLALIVTYTVAVAGLVLIPGQDAEGQPWRMDFFHAFYFVSFMSTTIGFGEIPYDFTDAQRFWVTFSIFLTVVVWFYSIGTLVSLLQDKTFQDALTELRFARRIRHLREPFYLVCGYGETGSALVRTLTDRNRHAVAIDIREERVNLLQLENLREYVPALHADASRLEHLLAAGLDHRLCAGVVALTNVNEVNLKIAIASKLMHPDIKVICRADSHEIEANMASFGTDHIYDPFDIFALYLATAIQAPCLTLLRDWLSGFQGAPLTDPIFPPAKGLWILCGFGRFGKAIYGYLRKQEAIELVVVESAPHKTGRPEGTKFVLGWGTEEITLEEAEVRRAVGLVAGTDDDANNLSIVMTARAMNPDLFVVARENQEDNAKLFQRVGADIIMHPSSIVADRIRVLLATPLLMAFEDLARKQEDSWACQLVSRIVAILQDRLPEVWEIELNDENAHAICRMLEQTPDIKITLDALLRDPRDRERRLPALALLHVRDAKQTLVPELAQSLRLGDRVLFCGQPCAQARMSWTLQNLHALNYVLTGGSSPEGWIWCGITKIFRWGKSDLREEARS